ncbi:MAG TPA: integrase family protein, partial [Phenylobacterium sp.]|nr:integrase family protein [Phenylobacterium sp.]
MSRVRLTAGLVETAKPAARDRFVWDTQVRGFGLKVTPAGGRIYVLQYRFHGRSRRTTIGRHGAPWTPHLARARARDLLGLVEAGRDPREAQRATHRSVAELCRLYLADGLAGKSPHALANARLSLDNHVIPRLGELEARLVGPAHVDRLQAQVAAGEVCDGAGPRVRGGRQAADAALAALSAVFGYAVRRGLVRRNPAEGIRRFRSRRVERYLSEADYARLGQVLAAAEALGVPSRTAVAAIRLIALAGLRPGEARALRWSDVRPDRSLWVEGGSGGRAAFVGEAAQAVIMGLPRVSPWLFPGRDGRRPCANLDPAWHQLRAAADLRDVRLIDLRHSFAAQAAGLGVEGPVLGRVMGLRQGETVARY